MDYLNFIVTLKFNFPLFYTQKNKNHFYELFNIYCYFNFFNTVCFTFLWINRKVTITKLSCLILN